MTRDTWAIIGTMVTIGSIIMALGAIGINQNSQLNTRIGDLREEMNARLTDLDGDIDDLDGDIENLRSEVRQIDGRVRAVEIEFAKVRERLSGLERAIVPPAGGAE